MSSQFSIPKEEDLELMSLDDFLIKNREASYMITMDSDDMSDFGILKNDIILVQKNLLPKIGDLVICILDGEFSLKIFQKDFPYSIEAVVISLIRKYI